MLPASGIPVSLDGIYRWVNKRGYLAKAEHIIIGGIPVQFIPAHSALAEETISKAADLDYEGRSVRVIRPEYLIAMSLEGTARTAKRLARVGVLLEANIVDRKLLNKLLDRYNLELPK